jgi:hypothetical protein
MKIAMTIRCDCGWTRSLNVDGSDPPSVDGLKYVNGDITMHGLAEHPDAGDVSIEVAIHAGPRRSDA